jgi:hypothetical protein
MRCSIQLSIANGERPARSSTRNSSENTRARRPGESSTPSLDRVGYKNSISRPAEVVAG